MTEKMTKMDALKMQRGILFTRRENIQRILEEKIVLMIEELTSQDFVLELNFIKEITRDDERYVLKLRGNIRTRDNATQEIPFNSRFDFEYDTRDDKGLLFSRSSFSDMSPLVDTTESASVQLLGNLLQIDNYNKLLLTITDFIASEDYVKLKVNWEADFENYRETEKVKAEEYKEKQRLLEVEFNNTILIKGNKVTFTQYDIGKVEFEILGWTEKLIKIDVYEYSGRGSKFAQRKTYPKKDLFNIFAVGNLEIIADKED